MEDREFEKIEKRGECPACGKIFTGEKCENMHCSNALGSLIELEPDETEKIQTEAEEWGKPRTDEEMLEEMRKKEQEFETSGTIKKIIKTDEQKPQQEPVITNKIELKKLKEDVQYAVDRIDMLITKWVDIISRKGKEVPIGILERKIKDFIERETVGAFVKREEDIIAVLENIKAPEVKGGDRLLEKIKKEKLASLK